MTSDYKKFFLLLKAVIFYYHGLNDDEKKLLIQTADQIDGKDEMDWALEFIQKNEGNAFSVARDYLKENSENFSKEEKIRFLDDVWKANNVKGYITEMEATGMLKIAKDWNLQTEFLNLVRPNIKK